MRRSFGITISAVITFLGSGATILLAASALLAVLLARAQPSEPAFLKYGAYLVGVVLVPIAVWGVASGVGLLRLREWARISVLLFSGLLLLCSVPGLIVSFAMPTPAPQNITDPERFRQAMAVMRIFIGVFYGFLISLSAFWLWFLNRRTTREQFRAKTQADSSEALTRRRPLSISIIAWFLLVASMSFPAVFFLHLPVFFLGFILVGWGAGLFWLVTCVLHVVMGIGLLKLQPWARITSIYYSAFFALNSLAVMFIPGAQTRLKALQDEILRKLALPPAPLGTATNPEHFPIWFGLVTTLPVFGVMLWFLIKSKPAFVPVLQPPE